nr:sialin [Onthophagus taurus]
MENVKEEEPRSARRVLWYLVFFGFAVNYMIRINLNIALVSMVKQHPRSTHKTSECIQKTETISRLIDNVNRSNSLDELFSNASIEKDVKPKIEFDSVQPDMFVWDEYIQGLILGAYFWLHWTTQIPGGLLAQKYGTKLVFGLSNFIGVLICFMIPFFSNLGYQYLITLRIIQGFITGCAWPAMHHMTAKWIPPNERSKFVTAYLGSSIGTALTYPLCGWIIDHWGWEMVFYGNGVLGSLWYILWYLYVYDSPSEHPTISKREKEYILSSLGDSVAKEKPPIPWKHILTSMPIWMNILCQFGGIWGLFTLMTHAPMYFKIIHGWDIKSTGILSGIPHILRVLYAFAFSELGDFLLRTNKLSRTNVRKLAATQCCILQGLLMLGLAYSGCNYTAAILFLSASTAANGAVSTGPLASLVDISPNYASISLGMCNTVVAIVGFLTPATVSYFTFGNQTVGQWQKVFWIGTAMMLSSGFLYLIFSKSEIQPWNNPIINEKDEAEHKMLEKVFVDGQEEKKRLNETESEKK